MDLEIELDMDSFDGIVIVINNNVGTCFLS